MGMTRKGLSTLRQSRSSPCGYDQERVKHTAAEQSPCGCDLYVPVCEAVKG